MTGDSLSRELESREPALEPFLLLADERVGADEPARLVELDDPAEPRLQRRVVLVHVVSIQTVSDFQAQRVARAQPAGDHALREQRVPELSRSLGRDEDFEAVLARVSGARDDASADAGHRGFAEVVVGEVEDARLAERIDQFRRVRSLHRDLRPVVRALAYRDPVAGVRAHPVEVLLPPAGVDADEEPLRREPVDDDVVDHAALFVAERAVLRLAIRALRKVVRDQLLRGLQGARALEGDLSHVRDVEHPDVLAHRRMFLEQALVLHGHLETRELDDAGRGSEVGVVERSPQRHGCLQQGAANLASEPCLRKGVPSYAGDAVHRARGIPPLGAADHRRAFVPQRGQVD